MKKSKKAKKKGCWRHALIIFLIFLLAAVTALLVNYIINRNSVDAKFQELLNREFDTTAFSDNVSAYRGGFATKLRNATGVSTVCNSDNTVNFDILMSDDCGLMRDWEVGKLDLALYCSDRNAASPLDGGSVTSLRRLMTCVQIEWTLSGQTCQYSMIYQISGRSLSNIIPLTAAPAYVYLTVNAQIDLGLMDSVVMYNYTINDLTGEDNEYCLNKIFTSLCITAAEQKSLAYTPFEYLEELNSSWNSSMRIMAASDIIVLKK